MRTPSAFMAFVLASTMSANAYAEDISKKNRLEETGLIAQISACDTYDKKSVLNLEQVVPRELPEWAKSTIIQLFLEEAYKMETVFYETVRKTSDIKKIREIIGPELALSNKINRASVANFLKETAPGMSAYYGRSPGEIIVKDIEVQSENCPANPVIAAASEPGAHL